MVAAKLSNEQISAGNMDALPESIPNGRREGDTSQIEIERANPAANIVIPQYRVLRTVAESLVSLGLVTSKFTNHKNI